nr:hypothetical protein [Tanacetum cinerariifolium]
MFALVLKPPSGINLAALWNQQSSVLPQTRSLTSQAKGYVSLSGHLCPSLTKKVFANMKRVGTGFTGVITPLFENMLVLAVEEVGQAQDDAKAYNLDLQHLEKVISMQDIDEEEPTEVKEVLELVTAAKLITEVVTTAEPTTTAAQVRKVSAPRRRRGVVIQDHEETAASVIVHTDVQPKDKGKGTLIEKPKPLKGQAQIKQDEAFAR